MTRILMIDSHVGDVEAVRGALAQIDVEYTIENAGTLADGIAHARREPFDILMLDLDLPDAEGLECLHELSKEHIDLPLLVISSMDDRDVALQAVQAGAQDYLVKQYINGAALARVISYAMERHLLLKELDAMRTQEIHIKDQFLSDVAHELRTPLACIYQFATILRDGIAGQISDDQREYIDIIVQNAQHLNRMMSDLLDLARHKTGRLSVALRKLDSARMLKDVVHMLQSGAAHEGIMLSLEVPAEIPPVYADEDRLRQVMSNLIHNGIKFTPDGGTITVRVSPYEQIADFIRVDVTDTGCGMKPEILDRVFERHYQDRDAAGQSRKGLGLGLYICKELVEAQGGVIWAASDLGEGTTISFTMPIFGLRRYLTTFCEDAGDVPDTMGVLAVRIETEEGTEGLLDSEEKAISNGIRLALDPAEASLIPDLYEVNPKGLFFIAAAQQSNGEEVEKRIGELFVSRHGLAKYNWVPHIEREIVACGVDGSDDARIAAFVSKLETTMRHMIASLGVPLE